MEQKLSDTLVKAIDRSNPFMQNLQLASRFNKLVEEGGGSGGGGSGGGGGYTHKAIIGIHTNGTNGDEEIYLSSDTSSEQGFIYGYWAVTSVSGDTLTGNTFEFNHGYAYKIYTDDENITITQTNRDRNRFSFTDNIATERDFNLYIEW